MILLSVAAIAAIGVGLFSYAKSSVGGQIRQKLSNELEQRLQNSEFIASVGRCELDEGAGIRIRNLKIKLRSTGQTIVDVGECFVQLDASLPELLIGRFEIQGVEIHRANLVVYQVENNEWNVAKIANLLAQQPKDPIQPVKMYLRDSQLSLYLDRELQRELRFSDINFDVDPVNIQDVSLAGHFACDFADQIQLRGKASLPTRSWAATFAATNAKVDNQLLNILPDSIRQKIDSESRIQGEVNLQGSANGNLDRLVESQFSVTGSFANVQIQDANLPFPLVNCSGQFNLTQDQIQLAQIQGNAGQGRFEQVSFVKQGYASNTPWRMAGDWENVALNDELYSKLSPKIQKTWREYSPRGTVDLRWVLEFDGRNFLPDLVATGNDCSFEFHKYPYRINNCSGLFSWNSQQAIVDLKATEDGQPVTIQAKINQPGPNWTGKLDVQIHGFLPINKKLIDALRHDEPLEKSIKDFSPSGEFSFASTWTKTTPQQENVSDSFNIQLRNCSIRHQLFDYPFYNVSGVVKGGNGRVEFEQLQGSKDNGYVVCNGYYSKVSGLKLDFNCQSVELDAQLRHAIGTSQQELWDRLQPVGTIDILNVSLTHQAGDPEPRIALDGQVFANHSGKESNVSIEPTWFPYRVERIAGKFNSQDGQIRLERLQGFNNDTWVTVNGFGQFDDTSWEFELSDLMVGSLDLDEHLYFALPQELSESVRKLEFDGLVNVSGLVKFSSDELEGQSTATFPNSGSVVQEDGFRMTWDLEFGTTGASLYVGIPIDDLTGHIHLIGEYGYEGANSYGEIVVDSGAYQGVQFTNLSGPISISEEMLAIGTEAQLPQQFGPPAPFSGSAFGGQIACDAIVEGDAVGEFQVRTTLQQVDLKEFHAEMTNKAGEIDGSGYAGITLRGNSQSFNSLRGEGFVRLRDAKIYEFPLIVALLKVARITHVDTNAFDEGNVDFTMRGSDIELNRIELIGDAVSLLGNGKMNLKHEVDLDFYTVIGRNRLNIPLLTQLYKAGSQQILWIRVAGSIYDPQTSREVLPGLSDTLKQIFSEFDTYREGPPQFSNFSN